MNKQHRFYYQRGFSWFHILTFFVLFIGVTTITTTFIYVSKRSNIQEEINHLQQQEKRYDTLDKQLSAYGDDLAVMVSPKKNNQIPDFGSNSDTEYYYSDLKPESLQNLLSTYLDDWKEYGYIQEEAWDQSTPQSWIHAGFTLQTVSHLYENKLEQLLRRNQTLQTRKEEYTSNLSLQEKRLRVRREQLKNRLNSIRSRISSYSSDLQSLEADLDKLKRQKERLSRKHQEKMEKQKEAHQKKIQELQAKHTKLERDLKELQKREATVTNIQEIDGKILEERTNSNWVYINLGSDTNIQPGVRFEVFEKRKGGKRRTKGKIEVKQVFDNFSKCIVLEQRFKLNPILGGDFITNPLFSADDQKVFVLAGNFGGADVPYTRSELKTMIEQAGASVKEETTVNVDFILIGQKYRAEQSVKTAKRIGVPLIRVEEILPFIGQ